MTQSYVDVNEAPHTLRRERTAERAVARGSSSHESVASASKVADTRSFVVALWSSVLLLVLGVVLIYHGSGPDQGLVFMSGSISMVGAVAVFIRARRALLERFERDLRERDMSEVAARHHARVLFDEVMGARKSPALDRSAGNVIDRFPLA